MRRTDELGINNYKLIQDTDLFCFGTDSVLLSDFASVRYGDKVLDLCTGNGIIPVLLRAKTKAKSIVGVEILKESYDLAVENAQLNGISDTVSFINADLKSWRDYFDCGSFDVVTCNPPYMKVGAGFKNSGDLKTAARHEVFASLDDVIEAAAGLVKFGGHFYMVHRADRLCDAVCTMRAKGLEPKRLCFVHASPDHVASLILIEGIKGARPSLKLEVPLYVNL